MSRTTKYSSKKRQADIAFLDPGEELLRLSTDLLATREAAYYLGKSPRALARLRASGELAYFKRGSRIFYNVTDLDEWLHRQRVRAGWGQP